MTFRPTVFVTELGQKNKDLNSGSRAKLCSSTSASGSVAVQSCVSLTPLLQTVFRRHSGHYFDSMELNTFKRYFKTHLFKKNVLISIELSHWPVSAIQLVRQDTLKTVYYYHHCPRRRGLCYC